MMKSSRITQLLLAALVDTQILNLIHFIGALGRYESPESASRACHRWADSAGQYSIRRTDLWNSTSQNPVRFCKQKAHHFVGCEVLLLKSATTLKIRKDFWQVKCQRRRTQASVGGTDVNAGRLS